MHYFDSFNPTFAPFTSRNLRHSLISFITDYQTKTTKNHHTVAAISDELLRDTSFTPPAEN